MLQNGRCVQKELQEVVHLRAEAEELQLARRTSAASEQSLQAHVGELEAQLHHCQAQLQQAQQQLGEIKPRLAASTKCSPPLPHALWQPCRALCASVAADPGTACWSQAGCEGRCGVLQPEYLVLGLVRAVLLASIGGAIRCRPACIGLATRLSNERHAGDVKR